MKKVMVFGSFDVLHKGHYQVLDDASSRGELHIVLARDETILQIKNQEPHYSATVRKKHLLKKYSKAQVHIGHKTNKLYWVEKVKPDVFVLGYDQNVFVDKLQTYCEKNPGGEIITLPAYKPHKYKSSIVKKKKLKMFLRKVFPWFF